MIQLFRTSIVFLFLLIFLFGCAGTKKQTGEQPPSGEKIELDESFDPLLLDDEDIKFETKSKPAQTVAPVNLLPEQKTTTPTNELVDGFRIQLISTKDLESATKAKLIAEEQFSDLQINFYLEFDSPYYKVRVGDFKSRDDAESIREVIRSRGYPKAWIVTTKVWTHPEINLMSDSTEVEIPKID
jgi:cell division protein FtsN